MAQISLMELPKMESSRGVYITSPASAFAKVVASWSHGPTKARGKVPGGLTGRRTVQPHSRGTKLCSFAGFLDADSMIESHPKRAERIQTAGLESFRSCI